MDILTIISGTSWTLVYILIIIRSVQDKTYGMPFWALAFNISWEFLFAFVLGGDTHSRMQIVINTVWFAFDAVILVLYFLWGRKEWPAKLPQKLFYPYSLLVLAVGFGFVYLMSLEFKDYYGMYAAFTQNLMMSVLFINMLKNRRSREGQAAGVAIFKMIGTLAPTIICINVPFVFFLGICCLVFDGIYLLLLHHTPQHPLMDAGEKGERP